ncbi:hypothetical protein F0562_013392 [Nyssa sinensis]|uniref:Uncharacterized protein n=1 Tax=Nyssa sinensis TaxID=561372 RepID=A0A5J4ZMU4_9ASTE|nr:hypothetical protein F0562_013392 [Nyssa sinensis]
MWEQESGVRWLSRMSRVRIGGCCAKESFTRTVEFDSSWATTAMAVAVVATGGGFTGLRITERIEDEIRGLRGGDSS